MLEWLGKILPDNISLNFSPKLTINNIKIGSDNKTNQPVAIDGKQLIIDPEKLDSKIVDQIFKELPGQLKHNDAVLEEPSLESLEEIDGDISGSNYEKELEKFAPIVPKADLPILKVAILIDVKYKKGESIHNMKGQLIQRYGSKAGMISNLYSSGYFHSLIMPLYEETKMGKLAIDEYLNIYEMIVTESPLAMFIGMGTTKPKAKELLLKKITQNKENEVGYLNIHGIGDSNVRLIKALLSDEEVCSQFVEESSMQLTGKSIKATIYI